MEQELRILETLVAFDTTSRRSNLELITWATGFARRLGLATIRIDSPAGDKANLLIRAGPDVAGGIVLSGHTDVVPVDGQPWTSDPWTLIERDGRYYARGAVDMKGFLALALAALERLDASRLRRPLWLALTYDEEVGCVGAPLLIERMREVCPAPAAIIVGEPTSMRVVTGHKGIRVFDVEVSGKEAHSSSVGIGISAIGAAVELMSAVTRLQKDAQVGPLDSRFDPPGSTMTIGRVEGGTAPNILARRCKFTWDLRCTTVEEADRVEAQFRDEVARVHRALQAFDARCGVQLERRAEAPPFVSDGEDAARRLASTLTGRRDCACVSYVAEAGLYHQAGWPVVLCGPGSIDQAHQPDEWIAHEQLVAGRRFIEGVIETLQARADVAA